MTPRAAAVILLALLCAGGAQAAATAHIENASKPTRCAEDDNVYVRFSGAGVAHLAIEARHPRYLSSVARDQTAPDFTTCDQSHDPTFSFAPLDLVLFEDGDYRLVGHRYASFWRPGSVDFRVGDTVTKGLHLVQLIRKIRGQSIEILVLYPSDGYWRVKPLPPKGRTDTAYGSSFLVGPIVEDGRPYVPLTSVAFMRSDLSFHMTFATGEGVLRVAESSARHTLLSVDLPVAKGPGPWAALRSMFTTPSRADTAEATVDVGIGRPKTISILNLVAADAAAVTFGRSVPSRHNTSAPDLEFRDFAR